MDLRVSLSTMINRALIESRRQTDRLARLQTEASTGKRLLVASDGPVDTVSLLEAKAQDTQLGTYLDNIRDARTLLNAGVSALQEAGDIFTKARQIAIEGSHSGNTQEGLDAMADEVDNLIQRLVDVANSRGGDRYLFAGTTPQSTPFVVTVDAQGRPQDVTYQGGLERATVIVGPQCSVATLYVGRDVFQSSKRGKTVFTGSTGATAGQGTDNATGQATLQVRHTATTYAAGSGIQAGTGSAAGDTIVGPMGAHQLTLVDTSGTGAFGTVSLDGGPPVAFSNGDTNLRVPGPTGDAVFVDTTAITAGFNGSVNLAASGTLSIDGGASAVAISFSSNQAVTDASSGAVTNVDSSAIRRTGDTHVEYPGTNDAFQMLITLRDDLRNVAGLSPTQQATVLANRIGELDRVHGTLLRSTGEQSATLAHLQSLDSYHQDMQLAARTWTTDLEAADLTDVVVQLQAQENQLRLTLAAAAKVMDISLLDFLQ